MPTILSTNLDFISRKKHNKKFTYERNHCNVNLNKFKKRLSEIKWQELLDNNDVNDDYDKFIERFNEIYDESILLKKCTVNRKKDPILPWITKGLLRSINQKKNYMNNIFNHQPTLTYKSLKCIKTN